ncbi:TlpA disulfide reductase family protein [Massilia sp. TS11]|uniref:TlpA family protein disulfide reductase n=1 Tax=Massilia sp. TS11 TaxID=2908003 RepID=UPI001EDAA191|nr:TlpA disulfide reductase family protein [Massilia sp. TS11]MCG2583439.1 redoxin family protein [Massilia sp. TS11]
MKKNLLIYSLAGLMFTALGAFAAIQTQAPDPEPVVATLLAQQLKDPAGQAQSLARFKGKPMIVNFWATWCAPCVKEMPELSGLAAELAPKGVQVLGIGIDSPSNIREFLVKTKVSYPIFVAGLEGTELSRQFGNKQGGLPFTVLVGADGKVRKTYLGALKFEQLRADLAAL